MPQGGSVPPAPPQPHAAGGRLPPLDRLQLPPQDDRKPWAVLIVAMLLEMTIPSLLWCWGVLLVFWLDARTPSDAGDQVADSTALRQSGMLWTPVLFTAAWSATDPWSDTLSSVHGHPRACALVGSILLSGGLILAGLGAILSPVHQAPLLPLLSGLSAGITAGVGASLLCTAGKLVVRQRWGSQQGQRGQRGPSLLRSSQRLMRSLGAVLAPTFTWLSCVRWGAAGALLVIAALSLHTLVAPVVLRLPRSYPAIGQHPSAARPRKYDRLKKPKLVSPSHSIDEEVQTESSDDGGSVSEVPMPEQRPAQDSSAGVTIQALVHFDVLGERQTQSVGPASVQGAEPAAPAAASGLDAAGPRPLYSEQGHNCNMAYSFDGDGDDDIEVFVKRLPPKQGRAARFGQGLCLMLKGCRADLRPLLRPSFHLSLLTAVCCRLAVLALAVFFPALLITSTGDSDSHHVVVAMSGITGLGGLLFGVSAHWEFSGEQGLGTLWRRKQSIVCAAAAAGFFALGSSSSAGWLVAGGLVAGYSSAAASAAQRGAVRDVMGGAAALRAQPLLSVLAGTITLLTVLLCDVQLSTSMAILGCLFLALSIMWFLQPYVSPYCW